MEGVIYGDTLNVYEKLDELENIDIYNKEEFIEELKRISKFYNLSKYKRFMYQDLENLFLVDYKDIKNYIKKGR